MRSPVLSQLGINSIKERKLQLPTLCLAAAWKTVMFPTVRAMGAGPPSSGVEGITLEQRSGPSVMSGGHSHRVLGSGHSDVGLSNGEGLPTRERAQAG